MALKTLVFGSLGRRCCRLRSTRSCTSSVATDPEQHYDIVISGGGMVGSTLACALAQNSKLSGQSILLLEGAPHKEHQLSAQPSNRVSALNAGAQRLLTQVGAWQLMEKMRVHPVHHMQVWEGCSDAMISFSSAASPGASPLAHIVENDVLLAGVSTVLQQSRARVVYGARVQTCTLSPQHNTVRLANGDTYTCKLLIGADGVSSLVRSSLGSRWLSWPYRQLGVVATLQLAPPSDLHTAWQRFLPAAQGPIALLPLGNSLWSLVWSTHQEKAKSLLSMTDEQFLQELNRALSEESRGEALVGSMLSSWSRLLGAPQGRPAPPTAVSLLPTSRAAFPLAFGHADRYVQAGVALVGDAAHRVHPLAGQGVNLGFGDVSCLVEHLADSVYAGNSIRDLPALLRYETSRQRHTVPTAAAIDGLHKLYHSAAAPVVLLRGLGLQLTNALPPLKKAIMRHATS